LVLGGEGTGSDEVLKQRFGIVVYQSVTMNNELNTRTYKTFVFYI
jgi:hypothetical protein